MLWEVVDGDSGSSSRRLVGNGMQIGPCLIWVVWCRVLVCCQVLACLRLVWMVLTWLMLMGIWLVTGHFVVCSFPVNP